MKLATTLLLIYQTLPLILVADLLVTLFPLSQLTFTFLGSGLCSRFIIVILTQSWNHYPSLLSSLLPLSSQVPLSIYLPLDQHLYSLQPLKLWCCKACICCGLGISHFQPRDGSRVARAQRCDTSNAKSTFRVSHALPLLLVPLFLPFSPPPAFVVSRSDPGHI